MSQEKRHLSKLSIYHQRIYFADLVSGIRHVHSSARIVSVQEKKAENEALKVPPPKTKRQQISRECVSIKIDGFKNTPMFIEIFPKFNEEKRRFVDEGTVHATVKTYMVSDTGETNEKGEKIKKIESIKLFNLSFFLFESSLKEKILAIAEWLSGIFSSIEEREGSHVFIQRYSTDDQDKHDYYLVDLRNPEKRKWLWDGKTFVNHLKGASTIKNVYYDRKNHVKGRSEDVVDISHIIKTLSTTSSPKVQFLSKIPEEILTA